MRLFFVYTLLFSHNLFSQLNQNSMLLYGNGEHASISSNTTFDVMNDFTICFWVVSNDCLNRQEIVSKVVSSTQSYFTCYIENYLLHVELYDGVSTTYNLSSSSTFFDGDLNIVAITRNGTNGQVQIFINGVLDNSSVGFVGSINNLGDLTLGKNPDLNNYFLLGEIDEITIWSNVLDGLAINELSNCPPVNSAPGLECFIKFDEGVGTISFDQTSNGHDASFIDNATWKYDAYSYPCEVSVNQNMPDNSYATEFDFATDLLGRKCYKQNGLIQLYHYSDGSIRKVFKMD